MLRSSKRVSISLKTARHILTALDEGGYPVCAADMRAAIAASAPKKAPIAHRKEKAAKDKAHAVETSDIRAAVMERAGYVCEHCATPETNFNPLTLEHMFGRIKTPQSVENCWSLCLSCHRKKTDGIPSAVYWFQAFAIHCKTHGYAKQARAALGDGEWRQAKKDADAARVALSRGEVSNG